MLPKKNRRNIIVNDVLYHYTVRRNYLNCITVIIQNTITNNLITKYVEFEFNKQTRIKPSNIKQLILENNV